MSSTGAARQSFWFQFVTTPTADTPGTTLILHFNNQRYVFGRVAEGTQRAFIQRGVGLRKLQNVFLTGDSSWSHQGGLLGMLLTTADVHASAQLSSEHPIERARINIHGPPGTAHMLASARRFIFRTGMPMSVHEYGMKDESLRASQPTYKDENVQVWALPARLSVSTANEQIEASDFDAWSDEDLKAEDFSAAEIEKEQALRQSIVQDMFDSGWRPDRLLESEFKDVKLPAKIHMRDPITKTLSSFQCASMSDVPQISPDAKVLVRQPWPSSRLESLPDRKNLPHKAVSYIVRGHAQRGVFEKAKALALGLKPGPIYSKLIAGDSVQMEDSRVITPEMVLGPQKPGRGIAIIDLPHKSFVSDLLSRPEWSDPEIMAGVECFCWLTSENVLAHPQIQDFIRSKASMQHIMASSDTCPNHLAMESSAASTISLSRLSRDHFPIPIHDNAVSTQSDAQNPMQVLSTIAGVTCQVAERGLTIQVEPRYQIQEQDVALPLNTRKVVQEIPPKAIKLADEVFSTLTDTASPLNNASKENEPEIVTLGTGSAVPSKYRNVSATLLKMPSLHSYYLFDCGENTLGQLKRLFSSEKLDDVLSNMRMIWISHLHADHHLGTLSLLQAIKQAKKNKKNRRAFALIADEPMIDFVRDMAGKGRNQLTASSMHHLICKAGKPLRRKDKRGQLIELDSEYLARVLDMRSLDSVWVSHCTGAQAVSVEFLNGFKISYSGDCRPSKNFARIGADSDVLIHEATFEDELEGDAYAKKHSTTSEALGVAAQMRAKNVILTHFSQRYQKIPVMTHIKQPDDIRFEEGAEEIGPAEPVEDDIAPTDTLLDDPVLPFRATSPLPDPINIVNQMNVCIAFDFMRTRVSQIKDMHRLYPAIEALFEAEQRLESEVPTERAEAINRSKAKSKNNVNGVSFTQGSKMEKRKSDDGEREGKQLSNKALKRLQRQQQAREDEKSTATPNVRKISTPDTAGSRHLDLLPEADNNLRSNGGLEGLKNVSSQADRAA